MDYSEGEFTIAKLDLQIHQKTIATLNGVHIADVQWRQGIVQIASISFDTMKIDARDTALFSQWLRELPSDTTTSGLPLAIANSSLEFFEIELPNDQHIQGNLLAATISFNEGVACEALGGALKLDTIETNVHITELYLGKSNSFQVDANSNLGATLLAEVQWNEKGIDCNARVSTTQDFKLSQIPEEWSGFTRGVDLDLEISGPSIDSIITTAQFHHLFFTGTAIAELYYPRYDLKGSLHVHQQAYDSTVL
ncbi:MAG: hypothetical protein ACPHGZ_08560, partial [Schleiferiaceae bacterium]